VWFFLFLGLGLIVLVSISVCVGILVFRRNTKMDPSKRAFYCCFISKERNPHTSRSQNNLNSAVNSNSTSNQLDNLQNRNGVANLGD
jgi:hypothetical protein